MSTDQTYLLGPQDDGSIVIRLPDEWHRAVLERAIAKQEKNATAADGTISALAPGDDPYLKTIQQTLVALRKLLVGARPPGAQLDGTPIGAAIEEGKRRATGGDIESREDLVESSEGGIVWHPSVPTPRPNPGDRIVDGDADIKIISVIGYVREENAFRVIDSEQWDGLVVPDPDTPGAWMAADSEPVAATPSPESVGG